MTNNNWRSLLIQTGATFSELGSYFLKDLAQEAEATQDNCVIDLSHLSLIAIQGPDAEKFLQGQLSCDVREVMAHQTRLGAHCNPKGRVIATFRLFCLSNTYYLQLPHTMLDLALNHLSKYAIFSKVTLSNATDELLKIGFAGTTVANILKKYFNSLPENIDSTLVDKDILIMRLPGITPRYEVVGSYETIKNLWLQVVQQLQALGNNSWDLLDIMAGIPSIYPQTSQLFTPHQLNYQLINGINFKKGCYTGQEVVARTQYLGKLKQHMYRAITQAEQVPTPGEAIFIKQGDEHQQLGEVVMSARAPGGYQMLIAMQDKGFKHRLLLNDKLITLLDLPYLSFA